MDNLHRAPGRILTVIIRDSNPIRCLNEPSSHRSVRVILTKNQVERLRLCYTGEVLGKPTYEEIDQCFIEEGWYKAP